MTREGARQYGVVIADDGSVDEAATASLREGMRAARGDSLPVFNYGPDIETLRANCEAETGLPAPKPPRWIKASAA